MTDIFTEESNQLRLEMAKRKLELYRPYKRQMEFHKAGKTYRERLLRAGNQLGKTFSAAAEVAMHASGKYPAWWEGRIFTKVPVIWCGGVTGEVTRDTIQRLLLGDIANPGTGLIPPELVDEITPSRGVADLADTILVRHISGVKTRIRLKNYEQGREKWQADTVDYVWLDEEPPLDLYMEALTRTNATGGIVAMTFTPLKGMSDVVRRFLVDKSPDRSDTNMTIYDAKHIPESERQKIIDSYPAHERDARINGNPTHGSGLVFPVEEALISCDAIPPDRIPRHWQTIGGLDFGWDHPTAACKLLYDTDSDIVYVTNVYRKSEATPIIHAAALRPWGEHLYFAWPHDGLQHDKGSGIPLAQQYRDQGLKLLGEHARFADGSMSVEAGINEMLMRMQSGRFKVYRHLVEFFEEFRQYHRKDGKIQKIYDDLLCAVRYATVSLRFADFVVTPHQADQPKGFHRGAYNPFSIDYVRGGQPHHSFHKS